MSSAQPIAVPFTTPRRTRTRLCIDGGLIRHIIGPGLVNSRDELDRAVDTDLPVRLVDAAARGEPGAQEELDQLRALRRSAAIHGRERLRGIRADMVMVDETADLDQLEDAIRESFEGIEHVLALGRTEDYGPNRNNLDPVPWSQAGGITRADLAEAIRLMPQVNLREPPVVSQRMLVEIERDSRTGNITGLVASGAYELQDAQGRRFHLDANGQAVYHPVHDGAGVHDSPCTPVVPTSP